MYHLHRGGVLAQIADPNTPPPLSECLFFFRCLVFMSAPVRRAALCTHGTTDLGAGLRMMHSAYMYFVMALCFVATAVLLPYADLSRGNGPSRRCMAKQAPFKPVTTRSSHGLAASHKQATPAQRSSAVLGHADVPTSDQWPPVASSVEGTSMASGVHGGLIFRSGAAGALVGLLMLFARVVKQQHRTKPRSAPAIPVQFSACAVSGAAGEPGTPPPIPPPARGEPAEETEAPGATGETRTAGDHGHVLESRLYARLCQEAGVDTKVGLTRLPGPRGRGLCALRDVREGEALLRVPLSCCLLEPLLPEGEWPAVVTADPDFCDTALRIALRLRSRQAGPFWERYARLFPAPQSMAQPLCLPPGLLAEVQNPDLVATALEEQQRFRRYFPGEFPAADAAPDAFPGDLMWLWRVVSSRTMDSGMPVPHDALVPFLDMANHAAVPNAQPAHAQDAPWGYELRALRDVRKGEEVTICYLEGVPNWMFLLQYGFVPRGNPHERLPELPLPKRLGIPEKSLRATLRSKGARAMEDSAVVAALRLLPLSGREEDWWAWGWEEEEEEKGKGGPDPPRTVSAELRRTMRLRTALQVAAERMFSTTQEEDERAVDRMMAGEQPGDPRLLPLLIYRVERKRVVSMAIRILADHEEALRKGKAHGHY